MAHFVLKALTGPAKGQVFPIRDGLKIGRSVGDLILKDTLVSDLHAEIRVYSSGKIMIEDQDSKNKIMMNRKMIVKSILEEGSRFQIGSTEFRVDFIQSPEEVFVKFMEKVSKNIEDSPVSLQAFRPPVELLFLSGTQKGKMYLISYGPRFFGGNSLDFPIFDKQAPDKAFALVPDAQDILFMTNHPSLVSFNGKAVKKASIQSGDEIKIGKSLLKIHLKQ